jgi:hypothetical protein
MRANLILQCRRTVLASAGVVAGSWAPKGNCTRLSRGKDSRKGVINKSEGIDDGKTDKRIDGKIQRHDGWINRRNDRIGRSEGMDERTTFPQIRSIR